VNVPPQQVPYVSIILPCYNEQDHVAAEVARICAAMDASEYPYEVLAFDDASTDETLARPARGRAQIPAPADHALPPQRRLRYRPAGSAPSGPEERSSSGPTPT